MTAPNAACTFRTTGNCIFIQIRDQKRYFDRTQGPLESSARANEWPPTFHLNRLSALLRTNKD